MNETKENQSISDFEKALNVFLSFLIIFCFAIMLLIGFSTKMIGDKYNYFLKPQNVNQFNVK
ncbi:MAG TPA: hypothetical protein PKY81_04430 [bacterium]|nr:hypothetical protein [bacterium]HPN30182.1 hypothetical protein [bacterium]